MSPSPQPRTVAAGMVLAFAATMLWFTLQGFLLLDDYELQALAYQAPWLDPSYLTQPWGGHFMPAGFALAQLLAKTVPFNYLPMAALITAGMTLFAAASARLFFFLLGNRWAALLPLGAVLVSGAIWDATTWWIASLNAVPLLVAIPAATYWHLRWLRDNRFRDALLAWGAAMTAALFFEKALGLVAFLGLISLALRGRWGTERRTGKSATLIVLYAVTVTACAVGYLASTTGNVAQLPDASVIASFLRVGLLAFPSFLLGGPWEWAAPGVANTPLALAIISLNAVLVLAIWQSVRNRRAALLWMGMLAYVIALIVVVASGRSIWGVQVIAQPRYFSEAVVYAVIIGTVSWAYLAPVPPSAAFPERWRGGTRVVTAVVAIQLMVIALATTLPALSRSLLANPSRTYVVGAIDALTSDSGAVLNGMVPGDVVWPLVAPRNQLSFVFSPMFDGKRFPDSSETLRVLNAFGAIRPGEVVDTLAKPPNEPCPWILRETETSVPLPGPVPDYWHTLRFTYLAEAPTVVDVSLGSGPAVSVEIATGLNESYVFLQGGGQDLSFTRIDDGVGVCLSDIEVGFTTERMP